MNILQKKEIEILRLAVDKAEKIAGEKKVNSHYISNIISIVEDFIKKKQCICYGGTAINNILPLKAQFYNKNLEIPDYDFFTPHALQYTLQLADIYKKKGYDEVEAKSGIHEGTFKIFVNYIPVADITFLDETIFNAISQDVIIKKGIRYAPPNFLRMNMYLELSRPAGDVSRWEKILKRLILLNKYYPLKGKACAKEIVQRTFEGNKNDEEKIYNIVRNTFIEEGLVFFGGYANILYSQYMPKYQKKKFSKTPDFDVLSMTPLDTANIVKKKLENNGIDNIIINKKKGIGEIIAPHYEIVIDKDTVAFIYEPLACHSYNIIKIGNKVIKIASIDTMLSFYLAFLYSDREYYDSNRILCMAQFLFDVQRKNRLKQKGLLRRFSIKCYGKQKTLENIRAEKNEKYKLLKKNKNSNKFKFNFLRYVPKTQKSTISKKNSQSKKLTRKSKK